MTEVTIEIGGVAGTAVIDESTAPAAAAALLASLPLETTLQHGYWSGMTCECATDAAARDAGRDVRVIGLLPGTIGLDTATGRVLISYGNAESRTALGPHYVSLVGAFSAGRSDLLAVLRTMHDEGNKKIRITRPATATR